MPGLRRIPVWSTAAAVIAAVLTGCSGSADIGLLPGEKLPPVDRYSGLTVDDGRIEVHSPKGWSRSPRSKDYLVRYQRTSKKTYPSVTVTADDPPEGFAAVSEANHEAFVEAIGAKLAGSSGKGTLTRDPTAVELGDHAGVAWRGTSRVKNGSKTDSIERLGYAVVIDGRLYTVEACGLRGKLDAEGILAAKAVASSLAVPEPETATEPEAGEPSDAGGPAEEQEPSKEAA